MSLPINQIVQGDCIEVIQTFPDFSIDCLVVDPPYSSGARRDVEKSTRGKMLRGEKHKWFSHDNMSTLGFSWFIRHLLIILKPKLKPNAHCYMFIDWRQYPTLAGLIESTGYRLNDLIIWDKTHYGLGYHYRNQHELISFFSNGKPREAECHNIGNIIQIKNLSSKERVHPTQKPFELIKKLIELSTKKGDLILDPMCGSGTTCIAANQLNRKYIGIDINPEYVELAKKQIEKHPPPLSHFTNNCEEK